MNKENFENYYQILGLPDFASIEEVKKAFYKLAHKYHPDKGGNPEKFLKILKAYKILSDEEKKKQFDEYLLNYKSQNNITGAKSGNQNINTISLKEPIISKIEKIFAGMMFFLPFFATLIVLLKEYKKISGGILLLDWVFGGSVFAWSFFIFLILYGVYQYLKNFLKSSFVKLIILSTMFMCFFTFNFWFANRIVQGVSEDANKSKSINSYQKNSYVYSENSFSNKTENKTISYDEAIENYWDDIKEYVNGYETIEACSDSGCYDLEAYISNGKIEEIDFPNGGYLYFDADINSYGEASDMDQDLNWWDFSIDMDSSIIQDAVSDWASDNGFEVY